MSSENATTEPRFGVKIVTAWFESVINPMLQALYVERERLSKKSWTWQYIPGRLESIRYIGQMIPAGYAPNLEQFAKYHPTIAQNIQVHDEEVRQLSAACLNLQRAILESEGLGETFARVTTEEELAKLGKSLNEMFFGGDRSKDLGWIAQEVINGSGEIPTYFGHSTLWNKHRDEFMGVLEHPDVSATKVQADRVGEKLLQTVDHLIEFLEETRERLSLEYDVPPVPTPSMVAA